MESVTCACAYCQAMCEYSTCLPTPDEARNLIDAGYRDRLVHYRWITPIPDAVGPAPKGKEGQTQHTTMAGECTFRLSDGRCDLHQRGLKPLEGRLARHDRPWVPIRTEVLRYWVGHNPASILKA